ncbi:uncharacterized protein F4822DRAFT_444487 [Hypoxylon trugodes]|uniref:uncharacterized protein n=1 Tax=Hypoxylon trugodes TaxID=326681 RepID=UPI00219DE509|nr:uncharacterized protein F4822DRAFT_444487 [Hypoxylon trugodes]KAI1388021.1 hypothetical protein F4822DRAFT_444487 [Hypoxylon trugodes]
MATPGATQALLGAFFFGILFNAASAALVLYVIGHGSAIFRDGLRLVLILFLASSAAWALVEFLSTIIEPTAASTCQVAVVFSSVFDQLGRVFIEQYLVWATRAEKTNTAVSLMPQILVLGRFGVGMAFIGLTGSEFNPTCVSVSKVLPIAATVIVLDAVILVLVAIRTLSMGSAKKGVAVVTIGLTIWTGTSVVLLLGMKATELVLKTTLPALGLAVLVALVTVLSGTLVTPRGPPPRRPDSPTAGVIGGNRDISSSDTVDYPPTRYEDVKDMTTMAMTAYASRNDGAMPVISMPITQMSGEQKNAKKVVKGNVRAKGAGKLVISNPVLVEQEGMGNPLDKIPTVDLATAANYEKERRIKLAQRGSTLIAQRPAPQPPNVSGQEGMLTRGMSMKRKEIPPSSTPELARSISTKTTKTTGGLSVEANASSTSSELSPGTDKMRRRSPRQPPAPPMPSKFQPIRPGEPVRIPIPRPRTPPESPKSPEPVKTPLQRRPTIGLPSNPRAQAMKSIAKEAESQRQETVMFINNIVYDDPNAVNNIMQSASKTPMTSLDSADSVVNRPRPIPRKGDKDRQVFPAELSPSHKRSKSGGSIGSRKSILQSMPGSPTQLPPLPPPPKSAGSAISRSLSNGAKSMTFDEKMDFLYTTPLSAPSTGAANRRRPAVPEMPPLPPTYMAEMRRAEPVAAPDVEVTSERRVSKTTDRSSVRTTSILGIEDIPQRQMPKADISRNAVDELGQSWLPGISVGNERQQQVSRDRINRKSSPVIPAGSHFSLASTSEVKAQNEDVGSPWGSVHSPVAPVHVQQSRLNAHSTYIQKDSRSSGEQTEKSTPPDTPSKSMEVIPENDRESPIALAVEPANLVSFHHRVGEECPAFSTRKDKGRLRKMPPPAPLILNGRSTKRAVIVQAAEPSPVESPEAAYQMIQAQLQRFEQPNRDSVGSQGQRLALLENLEREMGQLENQWQSSQNRLDRDSISTIRTSISRDSRPPSIAERRASRRESLRNKAIRSKVGDVTGTPSSQSSGVSSENMRASIWQARVAEAQMEYLKDTPDLIMKINNLNFLAVSQAALGSPSPPDTDESDYENEAPGSVQLLDTVLSKLVTPKHGLWRQQSPVQNGASSGLWVGVVKRPQATDEVQDLPGLSMRPNIRKARDSLTIESSRLWEKPSETKSTGITNGLWKKYVPSQDLGVAARPVTMRPPRKNKRVTLLPDILENPEPLPDKRGTLGLFQFPWGEKSDVASIQPRPARMYGAMPGTMTTGGPVMNASLDARSRQLEAEEFTTSFFDDYEAEEEGDNFDFSDSDDGEDFDENTLWEIASLLKTERLPSKNSLLPQPFQDPSPTHSPIYSNNETEMLTEDDYRDDGLVAEEPIPEDRPESESLLWTTGSTVLESHTFGLRQPEPAVWNTYIPEAVKTVRSAPRIEDIIPIQSHNLWAPISRNNTLPQSGLLWGASNAVHQKPLVSSEAKIVSAFTKPSLWIQPAVSLVSEISGLFNTNHSRREYRRTSKEPAALLMMRKPRAIATPLENLISKSLWTGEVTGKNLLTWEKPVVVNVPERDGLFENNMSRTDYRRTTKEPAAISMKRAPRMIKEPLVNLQTDGLWSREISVSDSVNGTWLFMPKPTSRSVQKELVLKAQTPLLWELPETNSEPEHEGLFNVNITRGNYRNTSKIPAAISMSKKPRSIKEPLPSITSTGLWAEMSPERELPISVPEPLSVCEQAPVSPQTNLLWEMPTLSFLGSDHEGLFDANVVRADYKRTSKVPAGINMTQRPRKAEESLATLTSTKLWDVQPRLIHVTTDLGVSLWNKPTLSMPIVSGLFQLDPTRKEYRTTPAEPAALYMVRKARLVTEPIPRLESTRLWSSSQINSVELDWITISSVRPRSPSVASVSTASSAPSSPTSDSSSVKTSTTKASSAKSTSSFFSGWFGKKKGSKSAKTPEDSTPKVAPEIPAVPELPEEFAVKNLDEIPHKKPERTPLRHLHCPNVAYRADWDGALREAIVASYPGSMVALRASYPKDWEMALQEAVKASHVPPKVIRKPASPRDWSAALREAVIASNPDIRFSRGQTIPAQWKAELQEAIVSSYPQPDHFDVTVRHPVFMGSLDTMAETIHPAVGPRMLKRRGTQSSPSQPAELDVAIRHPVFFGSMETSTETAHPAIDPKMLKRSVARDAPLLWANQPAKTTSTIKDGLWASNGSEPQAQTQSSSGIEVDMVRRNLRKVNGSFRSGKVEVQSDFSKQGMWKLSRSSSEVSRSQERDWLVDSMKKRFSRVELRY